MEALNGLSDEKSRARAMGTGCRCKKVERQRTK